jgi:hypothetical protein
LFFSASLTVVQHIASRLRLRLRLHGTSVTAFYSLVIAVSQASFSRSQLL